MYEADLWLGADIWLLLAVVLLKALPMPLDFEPVLLRWGRLMTWLCGLTVFSVDELVLHEDEDMEGDGDVLKIELGILFKVTLLALETRRIEKTLYHFISHKGVYLRDIIIDINLQVVGVIGAVDVN